MSREENGCNLYYVAKPWRAHTHAYTTVAILNNFCPKIKTSILALYGTILIQFTDIEILDFI